MKRIPDYLYYQIVEQLKLYEATKIQIANVSDDIVNSACYDFKEHIESKGYISDPTSRKGIDLVAKIEGPQKWITCIDNALASLSEQHRLWFALRHRKYYTWEEIMKRMEINKRTSRKLRREIILRVAEKRRGIGVSS